ncbi:lipoprotein-releasing ABC transporter permease subunit [Metallibacterium sp.]|uniref:lipoprotein-releasing ABC transporter permease subunit n=1 Tax=Metallibacterium sp. TaxID=2940281 RepID=UPI002605730C|nr:lipoprotein-releasing ABC transporter permease subunit [Metallibacterium sp.]
MFRPLSLFIGLRYTRAKRRNRFISFISLVSMLGIAVGVTALIAVISVMNGFDHELRDRILGMVAETTISGVDGTVRDWPHAVRVADALPHVMAAAPYVEHEAYLLGQRSQGAVIRGIEPAYENKVTSIGHRMVQGSLSSLTPGSWNIVLGRDLALSLGVTVGDHVVVVSGFAGSPIGGLPRLRSFTVSGIFGAGIEQYDAGLAEINMQDAQKLYQQSGPTGIRLKLDHPLLAYQVGSELVQKLGGLYAVSTWMDSHSNFFKAIAMEKKVMFIILSLIVAVAAFNLVSTLVMLVTDKQADIAILRTMGATPRTVMGVFVVQGMISGLIGIGLGVLGGVLLAINLPAIVDGIQRLFHVQFLSPDVYYISNLPSRLEWRDVGWIALLAFVFSLLATLYPAWRASRTQPAEALRYE